MGLILLVLYLKPRIKFRILTKVYLNTEPLKAIRSSGINSEFFYIQICRPMSQCIKRGDSSEYLDSRLHIGRVKPTEPLEEE